MESVYKSGFVTIVGRPNVGKSTLMNKLIGQKIAIMSNKPQTTRNKIQTIYTSEQGQIVFVDTPGIHKAKNKLGEYMVHVAERTFKEVDVILIIVYHCIKKSAIDAEKRRCPLCRDPLPDDREPAPWTRQFRALRAFQNPGPPANRFLPPNAGPLVFQSFPIRFCLRPRS